LIKPLCRFPKRTKTEPLTRTEELQETRLGCRGEDRLFVGLQHGQPGSEILGGIRARLASDTQIGAEESGSEFGDLS
jgi:hypothetical protein